MWHYFILVFSAFQTEYLALADQLSVYVVQLLDKVRGHDELEVLINKTGRDSDLETYERLARLKLAIQYNEKKVCSQKLFYESTSILKFKYIWSLYNFCP